MTAAAQGLPVVIGGVGPHAGRRLLAAGAPLARARLAMVMLHGRGGAPEDMAGLAVRIAVPDVAALAPEAAAGSWWPDSFLAPLEANEPGLGSALSVVEALLDALGRAGFGPERVVLVGFSQGACLALEAAARLAWPFRAVTALSGGLVGMGEAGGPPQGALYGHTAKTFDYAGSLKGVPVLIGCHQRDPHIPLARVEESAEALGRIGARVETMVIPGAGHGIVAEEIAWLRGRVNGPAAADAPAGDSSDGGIAMTIEIAREEGDTNGRYVARMDGREAEMTYSRAGAGTIIIDHTGVPDALRGRGVGAALVERAVLDARAEGRKVVPLCPFAKAQIARRPEWQDVLA